MPEAHDRGTGKDTPAPNIALTWEYLKRFTCEENNAAESRLQQPTQDALCYFPQSRAASASVRCRNVAKHEFIVASHRITAGIAYLACQLIATRLLFCETATRHEQTSVSAAACLPHLLCDWIKSSFLG